VRPAGAAGLCIDGGISGCIVPVLAVFPCAALVPYVCGGVIGRGLVGPVPCGALQVALSCCSIVQEGSGRVAAYDLPLRVASPAVPGSVGVLLRGRPALRARIGIFCAVRWVTRIIPCLAIVRGTSLIVHSL
jgi:hypothetical protein